MAKKKEFGDSTFFTITNHIWWLLMSNVYFWLTNILLLLVGGAMLMSGKFEMNWLVALSLLPMAPAFTALLSVMGKLTRYHEMSVTHDFFTAYRQSFFDALYLGTAELAILTVLWIDMLYLNTRPDLGVMHVVPKVLFFICLALNFYVFPLLSRFHLKKGQLMKLSLKFLVKKPHIFLTSFSAIYLLFYVFMQKSPLLVVLFSCVIVSYLTMLLGKNMLTEVETSLSKIKNQTRVEKKEN